MTKWKESPSFPDYKVSEIGQVVRIRPARGGMIGRTLKPYRREDGYNMYILRKGGRSYHVKAHQLVIEAFVGPKPFEGAEVCHNDGTRHNDHYSNLRWDTRAGNHADKVRHGTTSRGERHGAAKLSNDDVDEIITLCAAGAIQREVAEHYGVRQAHISRIVNGLRRAAA